MNSMVKELLCTSNSDGILKSPDMGSLRLPPWPLGVGSMVANSVPFNISLIWLNAGSRLGENA